jgi:hypothetical protein
MRAERDRATYLNEAWRNGTAVAGRGIRWGERARVVGCGRVGSLCGLGRGLVSFLRGWGERCSIPSGRRRESGVIYGAVVIKKTILLPGVI